MHRYLPLCLVLAIIVLLSLTGFAAAPPAVSPLALATASPTPTFAPFEKPPVEQAAAIYHEPVDPDLDNVLVPSVLSAEQVARLARDGVVASPGLQEKEFFTVYEKARYANVPIFVTSDSVLHVYHLLFDKTLRTAERLYFLPQLRQLNRALLARTEEIYQEAPAGPWQEAARQALAFVSVGGRLAEPDLAIPTAVAPLVEAELAQIEAAEGIQPSAVFPGLPFGEDYTQYIPRGHYTSHQELELYFKSMMWYGRMTFRLKTDEPEVGRAETRAALLLVHALQTATVGRQPALQVWADLYNPTAFLVGQSDDLTVLQYGQAGQAIYGPEPDLVDITDEDRLENFIAAVDELPPPRILGLVIAETDDEIEMTKGLRLMGQRFVPDAYIFRQLIYRNVGSAENRRGLPSGLDVMASLGSDRAYEILDRTGVTSYKNYPAQMQKMRAWVTGLTEADWTSTVYNTWLYSFQPLLAPAGDGYPAFMSSTAWQDKQLHTALGSWAELKHDTLLYGKQVYAEMGGGGPQPPRPIPARGYVEPVPEFYARLTGLVRMTWQGLSSRSMLSERDSANFAALEDLLTGLLVMAEKELRGEPLTEAEHQRIRFYGGELEHLVLASADTPEEDARAYPVLDEEPQAAVIADVATDPDPDGDGRADPVVLQVGVGRVNEIHVVVPLIEPDGSIFLQVAKGGIFAYYEFPWPAEDRLTDEAWRQMLDEGQAPPPPAWIDTFFTPEGEFSDLQAAVYRFQLEMVDDVFYLSRLTCCGQVMAELNAEIEALAAKHQYEGRQWIHTDYRSFDRQSDNVAVVTVRETWRDKLFQFEEEQFMGEEILLGIRGPYALDVTYTLERSNTGGWAVTRMVYANQRPAWQECAGKAECDWP